MLSEKIKEILLVAVVIAAFVVMLGLYLWLLRLFNQSTVPITVHEVAPGVSCAVIMTSGDAAMDCWVVPVTDVVPGVQSAPCQNIPPD